MRKGPSVCVSGSVAERRVDNLECPARADDIYLARGTDVDARRPVLSGDVYQGGEIPGIDDGEGLAAVIQHPCSMRESGGHLRSHLQVARVQGGPAIPLATWTRYYAVMPLPDLLTAGDMTQRAMFESSGRGRTDVLLEKQRVACLQNAGILFLMQRLAYYYTRYAVPVGELLKTVNHILEEADLLEEWITARVRIGPGEAPARIDVMREEEEFDSLMRRGGSGQCLQDSLRDPKLAAGVRRSVRAEMRRLPKLH